MRRFLSVVVSLACVALLSSCAPLGGYFASGDQNEAAQMQHIADAVEHRDPTAIRKLFSPGARHDAPELTTGVHHFVSAAPSHWTSWKEHDGGCGESGYNEYWRENNELFCFYDVSAGGREYSLFFEYIPEEDFHSDYVGLYALGMVPASDFVDSPTGELPPMLLWARQFDVSDDGHRPTGKPGVYIPGMAGTIVDDVGPAPADVVQHIADAAANHDPGAIEALFSRRARAESADLDGGVAYFLSVFPAGPVTWRRDDDHFPCVRSGDYATYQVAMCPHYTVSASGRQYDLYFTEYTVDQRHPDNIGIYSLGIAADTLHSNDSPRPSAPFAAWTKRQSPDIDGKIPDGPGVYVGRP